MTKRNLGNGGCKEYICPVLRGENLVDADERVVQRAEVNEVPGLNVTSDQLDGKKRGEQVDLDQE